KAAAAEAAARADDFHKGAVSLPALCVSAAAVFRAEADLAATPAERVAALERLVGVRRLAEKTVQEWFDDGRATRAVVLEARYERLGAEIELERARRQAPEGPPGRWGSGRAVPGPGKRGPVPHR